MRILPTLTIALAVALLAQPGRAAAQQAAAPRPAAGPAAEQRWGVSASQPALPWRDPQPTSGPRIPQGRSVHQDYLMRMAPPEFRASTMMIGSGLSADPGKGTSRIRKAMRERKDRKLKEQIDRELTAVAPPPHAR